MEKASEGVPLSEDLLDGIKDFAGFIGWDEQRTYRALRAGHIPAKRMGRSWIGRKSEVTAAFQTAASA